MTSLAYSLNGNLVGDLTYTYDPAGRRTGVGGSWARTGLPLALASATYDATNRTTAWGGTGFGYDLKGNLTSDGVTSYTWNARDELVSLSGGVNASFAYDALGQRRSKTNNGVTINFLYDDANIVQELSGTTPVSNLLTGFDFDEAFTRSDSNGPSALLIDAIGSTLALVNAAGTVQTQYTYDPFGATTTSGVTSTNAAQFTGRENDGGGLYYYRARYYHFQQQRFLAEDPIEFAGGTPNLYEFVANDPANMIDPTGTQIALPWPLPIPLPLPPIGVGGMIAVDDPALIDLNTQFAQHGKQRMRSDEFDGLSDEEVSRRARDRSRSGKERRKYQREEKARKDRNRQKRGGDGDNNGSALPFPPCTNMGGRKCG